MVNKLLITRNLHTFQNSTCDPTAENWEVQILHAEEKELAKNKFPLIPHKPNPGFVLTKSEAAEKIKEFTQFYFIYFIFCCYRHGKDLGM